jgi:hypothetical protein
MKELGSNLKYFALISTNKDRKMSDKNMYGSYFSVLHFSVFG